MKRRIVQALLAGCLIVLACTEPRSANSTVHDSAGIAIIQLGNDSRARDVDLSAANSLEMQVGGDIFFHRVAGAARLANGQIAIANRGTNQILFFDSLGRIIGGVGHTGAGPGEFNLLANGLAISGDTVFAFDLTQRRITALTSNGHFRNYPLQAPERANSPPAIGAAMRAPGSDQLLVWLQTAPVSEEQIRSWNIPNSVGQVPLVLFAVDSIGNVVRVLGEFPGDEMYLGSMDGAPPGAMGPPSLGAAPFGHLTRIGVGESGVYVLSNRAPEYRRFSKDGRLVSIYRTSWPTRAVTQDDRRTFLQPLIAKPSQFRASYEAMRFPAEMPAYREAIVGTDGIVWLEPYALWRANGPRTFVGFDSVGTVVGKVILTGARGRLLEIGYGHALILAIDSLGSEMVRSARFRF